MATMAGILYDSNLIVIRQIICYNKGSGLEKERGHYIKTGGRE